jgi:hypothetical protein
MKLKVGNGGKKQEALGLFADLGENFGFGVPGDIVPVQRRRYAVRWNRVLADRFLAVLSEALEDVYASIRRGRNGQGS